MGITLQPVGQNDEPVLFQIYASSRADEMALTGWDSAQQEAFLKMQFEAQRQSYGMQFPGADHKIVRRDEQAIGRLIVDRSGDEIRLIDIALLPAHRNAGIGTSLLKVLIAEAVQTGKPIKLHVEASNRALRLYERLGFSKGGLTGLHVEMLWRPDTGRHNQW